MAITIRRTYTAEQQKVAREYYAALRANERHYELIVADEHRDEWRKEADELDRRMSATGDAYDRLWNVPIEDRPCLADVAGLDVYVPPSLRG